MAPMSAERIAAVATVAAAIPAAIAVTGLCCAEGLYRKQVVTLRRMILHNIDFIQISNHIAFEEPLYCTAFHHVIFKIKAF